MRTPWLFAVAALLFGAWPFTGLAPAAPAAAAFVAIAVLFAMAASGGVSALAAASGALGAFGAGLVSPRVTALGGAIVVAAAFAERTVRVRGTMDRVAHVVTALLAGASAGAIIDAFSGSPLGLRGVAVIVSSVLAALPRLVPADDLVAHALDSIGRAVEEPARRALLAGAVLRRDADDALLEPSIARAVRPTWGALVSLAESRSRVQRSRHARTASDGLAVPAPSASDAVLAMLDRRIADHVAALARAYAAVDTARAAELGLDDDALRTVESAGEALDQVSSAILDVQTP